MFGTGPCYRRLGTLSICAPDVESGDRHGLPSTRIVGTARTRPEPRHGHLRGQGSAVRRLGASDAVEARRLIDICLEAGVNLFDTADVYSDGASEQVLGEAIKGRRDAVLISTKTGLPTGDGPGDRGVSRGRLIRAVEGALRRLGTDHIDLLQLHAFDASTPVEELLATLEGLVASGKVRYTGGSNYPGWQLMKVLAAADRDGRPRFVAHSLRS
ncbi:MAG: aldo/keto reductase, partial [Brevundimonas sp.]